MANIPADTLSPGTQYTASLSFFRIVGSDPSYSTALAAFHKQTQFLIHTTGGSDNEGPFLVRVEPPQGTTNVKDTSVVAFHFSEPMDPNIAFSQAIQWTGVADPNDFSYSWADGNRRLFARYTPGLPLDTTVEWTLNPTPQTASGSSGGGAVKQGGALATEFQDASGNPLQFTPQSGDFTTSASSNLGEKDILDFSLIKAEIFFQEGASADPLEEFIFSFETELNGFNTASSVTLTEPGGSPKTFYAEGHGDELDVEAEYAEKADLDSFIPNGMFTVQLNTFRDGTQTVNLNMPSDAYPNTPVIQNHAALTSVDPTQPFTLTWNSMSSPGPDDVVIVFIENENGREIFETFNVGEMGALAGSATSVTIPANTLPPGRTFEAEVAFVRAVDIKDASETPYLGVLGVAAFARATLFDITTTGAPIVPSLDMVARANDPFQFRLVGEKKMTYTIESSVDFSNWVFEYVANADQNIDGTMGDFTFFDNNSEGLSRKYYRAREGAFYGNFNNGGGNGNTLWQVAFYPALELTACNGGDFISFDLQSLQIDGSGNFSETWSPLTPLITVSGNLDQGPGGSFSAAFNCIGGGQTAGLQGVAPSSGSMSGSENNGMYTGSFSFENSGSVVIVQQPSNISVQGRVVEAGSGTPIAGATVTTTSGGSVTTDANGFFFLITDEPEKLGVGEPFSYCIDVRKTETHSDAQDAGCAAWGDHPAGLTFTMSPLD